MSTNRNGKGSVVDREAILALIAGIEAELEETEGYRERSRLRTRIRYWQRKLEHAAQSPAPEPQPVTDPDASHYVVRRVKGDARWYIGTDANPKRLGPWPTSREAKAFLPYVSWALANERGSEAA